MVAALISLVFFFCFIRFLGCHRCTAHFHKHFHCVQGDLLSCNNLFCSNEIDCFQFAQMFFRCIIWAALCILSFGFYDFSIIFLYFPKHFFLSFWFLTKISYVIDVDCFQLSLIIWTFSTGLWCDSGSSSSQMNPKQQRWSRHLNTNQRRVPKRAHSREEVIVKFLVWLADLVVVVILCWFFVLWNVTSTNHVSFLMFSVYNRSCSLHCDNVLQTMLFTFINITYRFKYIR